MGKLINPGARHCVGHDRPALPVPLLRQPRVAQRDAKDGTGLPRSRHRMTQHAIIILLGRMDASDCAHLAGEGASDGHGKRSSMFRTTWYGSREALSEMKSRLNRNNHINND